jgi:hypothetical protein
MERDDHKSIIWKEITMPMDPIESNLSTEFKDILNVLTNPTKDVRKHRDALLLMIFNWFDDHRVDFAVTQLVCDCVSERVATEQDKCEAITAAVEYFTQEEKIKIVGAFEYVSYQARVKA